INSDLHFRVDSDEAWHAVGDVFLPKEQWEPLFAGGDWSTREGGRVVGLRTMTVEVWRSNNRDYMRGEVGPSQRIPLPARGVYIGINTHLQITDENTRGTGLQASESIGANWDEIRALERSLQERIDEWAP